MRKPETKLMSAIFCTKYGRLDRTRFFEDEELEESIGGVSLRDALYSSFDCLSWIGGPRFRICAKRVLELRFGFVDGIGRTFAAIAPEFHVTRERIRQIEQRGLRCLRHPSRSRALEVYIKSKQ